MKPFLLFFVLACMIDLRSAVAQPVWDPTEIARLSEQAAQLGTNLTALIDNLQTFDKLASEVGSLGARPLGTFQTSSTLIGKLDLKSSSMPSGADAFTLISNASMTATQTYASRQVWGGAYEKVISEGFSLAEVANQDLEAAKTRSESMKEAAKSTQDLRGDVQANSAVCLALLSELGSVQAILTLLLEQQSLARLASAH